MKRERERESAVSGSRNEEGERLVSLEVEMKREGERECCLWKSK